MLIKTKTEIPSSEITPEGVYKNRREFLRNSANIAMGAGALGTGLISPTALAQSSGLRGRAPAEINLAAKPDWLVEKVRSKSDAPANGPYSTEESLTPFQDATNYNNFFEFGNGKGDPASRARDFKIDPWSVEIAGEVNRPGSYNLEDIMQSLTLEERVYRMRCVEAFSMVIPWIGFPLADLINRFEPNGNARFIEFETLYDPEQMPGQAARTSSLGWPYREGLRMDEAMHPLTILAVGMYDDILPAQNGAPFRLVVPWKYGYKSIKSIVKINFRQDMPNTAWNDYASNEYGFYSNVNPQVSHPRWSQATERRLPSGLFDRRIPTQLFNGYAEEVAHLYDGMDLRTYF